MTDSNDCRVGDIDLFALTAELVDVASESFNEQELVADIEQRLSMLDHLTVDRVGDNVVARTTFGHDERLILAGHTDTVPANGNGDARVEGDVLWGLGSTDMKGGLAIMLASAHHHRSVGVDLTYVFYAREEVAASHSGLKELIETAPQLVAGDLALIGEPTNASIEAGCQGSVRVEVRFVGARAHTARAWMGSNAIHRAGRLLAALETYEPRSPVLSGCQFHEAMQAVAITGGVSGNVVPDEAIVTVAHRFAPDRGADEAEEFLRDFLGPLLAKDDEITVVDVANSAPPAVDHPLLAAMIERSGLSVDAKLGWTDVARFHDMGIPAANFGPGDPTIAHTAEEHLQRSDLVRTWAALDDLISSR